MDSCGQEVNGVRLRKLNGCIILRRSLEPFNSRQCWYLHRDQYLCLLAHACQGLRLRYAAMSDAELPLPGCLVAFPGQGCCVAWISGATCGLCAAHSLACSCRWLAARPTLTHKHLYATPWLTPLHCLLQVKPQEVELVRRDYVANGGWETFLSYEDPRQDILVGLLRLRQVGSPTSISALPQLLVFKAPKFSQNS